MNGAHVVDVSAVLATLPSFTWPFPRHDIFIAALDALRPQLSLLAETGRRLPLSDVRLLSPVANPGKIIGAPVNYQRHLDEARGDAQIHFGGPIKTIQECGLFLKASTSLIGAGSAVISERGDRRTDHEIELALIIGKFGKNIREDDALAHVAGYCIGLDMTIRGTEERSLRKSRDTFSVLGPWLVTADEFGDPSSVDFELQIDGASRQKANTRDLIFDCRKLVAYASEAYTLEPGDVIMTGTPEGVSPVEPGDVMECWMDRIGRMEVRVDAGSRAHHP